MNTFTTTGNIGKDCEGAKYLKSGAAVASFSLATTTGFGDREATLWIRCNIWGKKAESKLTDYLVKGQLVEVSGELSESTWPDKEGNERKSLELKVHGIKLHGKKQSGSDRPGQPEVQDDSSVPF